MVEISQLEKKIEELEELQRYNRGLIEASIDPMLTTDNEGVITDVNKQMVNITGHSRKYLIGTPFKDYFTDPERAYEGITKPLAKKMVRNYELTLISKKGNEIPVSSNAAVFTDAEGNVKGVFAIVRDMTEYKKMEQDIRESQLYNRTLIESSLDPMLITDTEAIITDVNEQMINITGRSREELIGTPFKDYFTDPERAYKGITKPLAEKMVRNYELTLISKKGNEIPVSSNAAVFTDSEGNVKGVFAIARDMTEYKKMEHEIRESQLYNRTLIESSLDPMLITDTEAIITDVNEQMINITGRSREELIGTPFKDYFTDPERAYKGITKPLAEKMVRDYELTLISKKGKEIPVSSNAAVFTDSEGNVKGVFAIARDMTEYKKMEQDIRESQLYNRTLIESSLDPMLITDTEAIITDVNEQMINITGRSREELIGTPFKDYFTDPERAYKGITKPLAEKMVRDYELTLISKKGNEIPVSSNAAVFTDSEGNVKGVFAIARDMTEYKKMEHEIRESQLYNRTLIESSLDPMLITDTEAIITDVNEQMINITGRSREELIGTPFKDYFTDPERAYKGITKPLAEKMVRDYELTLISKKGKEIPVSSNAAVFTDSEGNVKGVFAIARDMTEYKKMEQDIRESQLYNRTLIESSLDPMLITDTEAIITDVNEQMINITGRSREELIGTPFKDYFTDPERAYKGITKPLAEKMVRDYELTLISKKGKEIPVSSNAAVFTDSEGNVKGVFAIARDMTEYKKMEQDIRESQLYNRTLIESSLDPMLTTDTEAIITDVNEQMINITGRSREELIGTPFKDYFTDPERAYKGITKPLAEKMVRDYELTLISKKGKEIPVSSNAAVFTDSEGNVKGVFAIARDMTEYKKMEQDIRESQLYNRTLIESSLDPMLTTDTEAIITDVNEQMINITRRSREELIGTPFKDYFTDPERAYKGITKPLAKKMVRDYELTLISNKGDEIPVSSNAAVFTDSEGNVKGVFAIARDMTEYKKMEHEIRESQLYNRTLIESSLDPMLTTDTEAIITDVNEQMINITGRSREELIGTPFKDYFTDPERAYKGITKPLAEKMVRDYELTLISKKGKEIPVSSNAAVFTDSEGNVKGVFAVARDMTEHKRLENELKSYTENLEVMVEDRTEELKIQQESESSYNQIMTVLNASIDLHTMLTDGLNEIVKHLNAPFGIIHLYDAENNVLKPVATHALKNELLTEQFELGEGIPGEAALERKTLIIKDLPQNKRYQIKFGIMKADPETIISIPIVYHKNLLGTIVIGFMTDVSEDTQEFLQRVMSQFGIAINNAQSYVMVQNMAQELQEYSGQLERSNQLKDLFTDILRHDLLNPAGLVRGFTDVLMNMETDEKHKELLNKVHNNNEKLIDLIETASKFAKLESTEELEFVRNDIGAIFKNIVDNFEPLAKEKEMAIEFLADGEYFAKANPIIEDVFSNLLSNAIKYSPKGSQVVIDIQDTAPDWRVSVTDFGFGIAEEDKSKLFQRFKRVDKKGIKGTGLGLAIVKRIVELHGGDVGIENNPAGQGSVFWVTVEKA